VASSPIGIRECAGIAGCQQLAIRPSSLASVTAARERRIFLNPVVDLYPSTHRRNACSQTITAPKVRAACMRGDLEIPIAIPDAARWNTGLAAYLNPPDRMPDTASLLRAHSYHLQHDCRGGST